jgi:hypothetical protein
MFVPAGMRISPAEAGNDDSIAYPSPSGARNQIG